MVHGGSKSARWFGRQWLAAAVALCLVLMFTAASGPADLVTTPPADAPELLHAIALSSATQPATPRISVEIEAVPVAFSTQAMLLPDVKLSRQIAPAELLHDLPAQPTAGAATVSIPPQAVVAHPKLRRVWVEVTAYCSCRKCCGSNARGITSSGRPITYNDGHFLAADLKLFPYGTRIIVPGYNDDLPVEVIDRGGAIRGYHIDIFLPTHEQAVEWGKKRLEVIVME